MGLLCSMMLAGCGQPEQSGADAVSPATVAPPPSAASTRGAAEPTGLARYDGYGDMRFGMDEATFDKAWGGELKGAPEQDASCFYRTPAWVKLSRDFAFMFEQGHFVRYDVGTRKEVAPGGGRVGMSIADIRRLYGDAISVQPHKYVEGAKNLRVVAPAGDGVLVFETDAQGKVTRWHAGVPPQVDYVEGCG